MKKIIIALCLWTTAVCAEEWFEMPNQAGGKILLLTGKCSGKNGGNLVISTTTGGRTLNGCWYVFANMVHIVWDDGTTSAFSPSSFTHKNNEEKGKL